MVSNKYNFNNFMASCSVDSGKEIRSGSVVHEYSAQAGFPFFQFRTRTIQNPERNLAVEDIQGPVKNYANMVRHKKLRA